MYSRTAISNSWQYGVLKACEIYVYGNVEEKREENTAEEERAGESKKTSCSLFLPYALMTSFK